MKRRITLLEAITVAAIVLTLATTFSCGGSTLPAFAALSQPCDCASICAEHRTCQVQVCTGDWQPRGASR